MFYTMVAGCMRIVFSLHMFAMVCVRSTQKLCAALFQRFVWTLS